MAPPIVRGRQLLKQRLFGLLFLVVLFALVALTIAQYNKFFADTVTVTLQADRLGNQLSKGGDVKARGLIVGEIRSVSSSPTGAEIELAIDRDKIDMLPSDAQARLLPKTLFGEKFVSLVVDSDSDAPPLQEGDVIPQDRSQTAREFATALDNALPLLRTLKPEQVSLTLNALSSALRGRGERIGENAVLVRDYLREFNPELPTLAENFRGLADFADTLEGSTDDIVEVLDNLSAINRNLVDSRDDLDQFLRASTGVAGEFDVFLGENEQRFITLARESAPNLRTYARYSPQFACMSQSLVDDHERISDSFGNLQPGLHITLEFTESNGPYLPGDEPEYIDDAGPTCRSLGRGPRERPIPEYRDGTDGYRDGQPVDERTGQRGGPPPTRPDDDDDTYGGEQGVDDFQDDDGDGFTADPGQGAATEPPGRPDGTTTRASGLPFSTISFDRMAVGEVVAPALGLTPEEVPDLALLLFAPMARDTVVTLS